MQAFFYDEHVKGAVFPEHQKREKAEQHVVKAKDWRKKDQTKHLKKATPPLGFSIIIKSSLAFPI